MYAAPRCLHPCPVAPTPIPLHYPTELAERDTASSGEPGACSSVWPEDEAFLDTSYIKESLPS